ncbi:protein of unknown function DUF1121 [Chitinispirillum alkaliphilum]|nr:protein of unknown function DUF1121 [Chitinispirillum alkaliphilum]
MDRLNRLRDVLNRHGFEAEVFKTKEDASGKILETVKGCTVGFGGSMTLRSMGVIDKLKDCAKTVFSHLPGGAGEDERNALTSDYYLTSANAVSEDGQIVNIDGTGNRVSATCFGPARIIYVIGKNKIVEDLSDAMARSKFAAVKLAKYYERNTPCVKTGRCENCYSSGCICSITTIHRRKPNGIDVSVFLIDEELGM